VIRYRIEKSPYEADRWILHNGSAFFGGTWRECAEKLRELHPDLFRHKVTIEVRKPTQSVRDYVNSITGTHLDQSLKR
jgi:hypothetical protein